MDTPKADKVILENSKAGLPCVLVEVRGVQRSTGSAVDSATGQVETWESVIIAAEIQTGDSFEQVKIRVFPPRDHEADPVYETLAEGKLIKRGQMCVVACRKYGYERGKGLQMSADAARVFPV